ncbi:MAG: hypothetical protein RR333_08535, partial [Bacteroidales bacterium]
ALKPKELVALLERSLEIGVDAVMRGEVPTVPAPTSEIRDFVQIAAVDLSAYDRLYHGCKEAAV